jgi:hypothetical protein
VCFLKQLPQLVFDTHSLLLYNASGLDAKNGCCFDELFDDDCFDWFLYFCRFFLIIRRACNSKITGSTDSGLEISVSSELLDPN